MFSFIPKICYNNYIPHKGVSWHWGYIWSIRYLIEFGYIYECIKIFSSSKCGRVEVIFFQVKGRQKISLLANTNRSTNRVVHNSLDICNALQPVQLCTISEKFWQCPLHIPFLSCSFIHCEFGFLSAGRRLTPRRSSIVRKWLTPAPLEDSNTASSFIQVHWLSQE